MAKLEAPFKVGDRVQFAYEKGDEMHLYPSHMAVGTVVHVDDPVMDDMPCKVIWDDPDWKERNWIASMNGAYYHNDKLAPYNPAPTFYDLTGFEEVD